MSRSLGDAKPATCPHCDFPVRSCGPHCPSCGRALEVCGGFRLGPEIDRGGMARIHSASGAQGEAAIKLLERDAISPWQVHQLFARSARVLSALHHAGLPKILGFEKAERRSFLAMERLRGGTLHERVRRGPRLDAAQLEALLMRLLETAGYLHGRAYVHGDVTPRNVMFRDEHDEQPVLVDFDGLCATHERGCASLVMTPGFTAPEQKAGEIGIASDLYGIGATVVFAATGKSPDELLRRGAHLEVDLSSASITPRTRAVLMRLVDLEPTRRPKSASEALRTLRGPTPRSVTATLLLAAVVVLLVWTLAAGAMALVAAAPARPL
ncbi:MAG: serine/threonine protein kinase [Polyangiales bacterium]